MSRRTLLVLLALLVAACTGAAGHLPAGPALDHRLYVTSNDWHTRIVVAAGDIGPELIPERADLAPAAWLAIGWGDRTYYPMRDPPLRLALEVALVPTASVLHLVPMPTAPRSFPDFEVLELKVTGAGLQAMLEAIDADFERAGAKRAPVAAPGLYPESLFYPATGTFHLFNTCNRWVASQVQRAGVPVRATGVITAEDLMRQLRGLPRASDARG